MRFPGCIAAGSGLSAAAVAVWLLATAGGALHAQARPCVASPNVPLPDLTVAYRGFDFGLYPNRQPTMPDEHRNRGLERAMRRIQPLAVDGRSDPNGRIMLLSLGMSNTGSEFARFIDLARSNPAINRRLTIANGALSGADAALWTDEAGPAWRRALAEANGRGSAAQVQVVWIKQAHLRVVEFPAEVENLKNDLARMVAIATKVFPNLQLVYVSSRTRAAAETRRGPGETQAYETAFAVRQLLQEHFQRPAERVWVGWGPYLWANETPRSDGFTWTCADVQADLIHPTPSGDQKVALQLMAFFMSADSAAPWFLEPTLSGGPAVSGLPGTVSGNAPFAAAFSVTAPGAIRYYWSFDDGTFATGSNPRKLFRMPGRFSVRVTAVDESGRWSRSSVRVVVGAGG